MKKKVLASLMTVVMAASLMAGCGSSGNSSSAPAAPAADTAAPAADTAAPADDAAPAADATAAGGNYKFEVIVKSYQSSYWQAAVTGVNQKAQELGVTVSCTGPNAESDIADQVNMLNSAISNAPDGIGLAACDQSAVLDSLQAAMDAGIPVVAFDSGVPDAPAGSLLSTIATDNYGAGAVAAENLYPALKDKIAAGKVRVGEVNQEATSESITSRGLGFIDKFAELAVADGKSVAVIGNEYYVSNTKASTVAEGDADIIIEVGVPAQTTVELCATEASAIMSKSDTIGMFGSNQVAAEGILTANDTLQVLGADKQILAAGFDAGSVIKGAITAGTMYGAVTQSPLAMGQKTVETLVAIANGESVSDIATDGEWYNADNMNDDSIAPNLYD